jgi:hypothetical protein
MPEPTRFLAVEDLDAVGTLAAAESAVRDRRAAEVRELELALHWADLHAHDPRADGQPLPPGASRLVQLGGAGTPLVQDLALCAGPAAPAARAVRRPAGRPVGPVGSPQGRVDDPQARRRGGRTGRPGRR